MEPAACQTATPVRGGVLRKRRHRRRQLRRLLLGRLQLMLLAASKDEGGMGMTDELRWRPQPGEDRPRGKRQTRRGVEHLYKRGQRAARRLQACQLA